MCGSAAISAVGLIYEEHGAWLRSWLRGRTRCAHWAADLTQETFCRLMERQDGEPIRDPRSLLAVIARRLLIDDVRRRDLEQAYLLSCQAIAGEVDMLTPERILEAVELLRGLVALLADMPAQVREAFLLRKLDGLTHIEIGERLGLSDRTVKRHIARAYAHCYALAFPR